MWGYLPVLTLLDMQRQETIRQAGVRIRRLFEEGYMVDADRELDVLCERMRSWEAPC